MSLFEARLLQNYELGTEAEELDAQTLRKYSSAVGRGCHGTPSEVHKNVCSKFDTSEEEFFCRNTCATLCNSRSDCEAFVVNGTDCELYNHCTLVTQEGCQDCNVAVCLENCPEHTVPYYASLLPLVCSEESLLQIRTQPTRTHGSAEEQIHECSSLCVFNENCTNFVADRGQCKLYADCSMEPETDDKVHNIWLGTVRREPLKNYESSEEEENPEDDDGLSLAGGGSESYSSHSYLPNRLQKE
eukprot:CAMPEP_0177603380 /NCGR_PEP_ID=MMETSP0419_2-20121207/15477_1 /TAXON_ID=582737 /ORGANISM="Tetraselmis sp., Strain GSL018" /LENGTH=243 /DNA_ID=CAMNT_0019097139 /DNA_START=148 /DNA_END=880 /DNA_ORIENTATION=+